MMGGGGVVTVRGDGWGVRCHMAAMSTMIAEVYDAFVSAGAPTEKAAAAATAVADYDAWFSHMDVKIESRFAKIEGDLLVLKWMTGVIVAGVVALIFKAFCTGRSSRKVLGMTAPPSVQRPC